MPTTTTKYKIPYPIAADKVSDYPATAKQTAEATENAIISVEPLSPIGGRITPTPPTSARLRVVAWNAIAQTNQHGQAILTPPAGINGIKDCVVSSARFDTEDSGAFADVVAITGSHNNAPIVTITRNGQRRANTSTFVQVFGIGW